ncbi:MAG: YkgJ family cysteine cluster protein [Desulfuromonadales bacterium]
MVRLRVRGEMLLMECRVGCAACCIAPSISSPIPGMPSGKPAGFRCIQLTADNRCQLFDNEKRPSVCRSLRPSGEMCGINSAEALERLAEWERLTCPVATSSEKLDSTL